MTLVASLSKYFLVNNSLIVQSVYIHCMIHNCQASIGRFFGISDKGGEIFFSVF